MKHPIPGKEKAVAAAGGGPQAIAFSITNQHGEQYRCCARNVSLRIKRGAVQMVMGERGCFVWFDRCRVELRDGRRNILYRLLAGSASSEGADLTIVAEVMGDIGGTVKVRLPNRLPRKPTVARGETTKALVNSTAVQAA